MTWRPPPWLVVLAVALLGVIVFTPGITGGWIYDDKIIVAGNKYVHSFADWPHWFVSDFWNVSDELAREPGRIAYWRPAVSASYALDWTVGGGSPVVFHVTNLVWHGVVGVLSFVILRRWLGSKGWAATLATLLFLVHPTKAESVAWISGRTDVICMAALLLATHGVARRLRGQHGGVLLEATGTVLAYASKEQAIVLPAFVMIEAWIAADRPAFEWRSILRLLRVAAPQIGIAVIYVALRTALMPIKAVDVPSDALPVLAHVLLVLETFGRFATLAFVPHNLSTQHGLVQFAADGSRVNDPLYIVIGGGALVAFIALALIARRRLPEVTLGIAFFLVTLAPTMNIVNTQMVTVVSERFLYLPAFGLAFAVGAALLTRPHRAAYTAFAIAIVLLTVQSVRRSSDFADEQRFWERELALHPDSGEARRSRIREAYSDKRYREALHETLELSRMANVHPNVSVAMTVADLVARLTPDRDRAALEAIDAFCRDMLARKRPAAVLKLPTFEFKILTEDSNYPREMVSQELALIGLHSTLRSRLGDDEGAIAVAQMGLDKCPRCERALITATLALAKAGRYDDASAVLVHAGNSVNAPAKALMSAMITKSRAFADRANATTGPDQLRARAAALGELELWGRAYEVLEPYKDEIRRAPKAALGFAELAFRAGEKQLAREVLAQTMQPPELEATLASWTRMMGWDQPRTSP